MGSEVAYLLVGAVVLLLATLSDHPRFKSRQRTEKRAEAQTGAEVTAQDFHVVLVGPDTLYVGSFVEPTATSGSVSPEAFESFQTPAPGVTGRREFRV